MSDDGNLSNPLCSLWQAALKEEVGLAIVTDNRGLLRQHLYRARAQEANPDFEKIVIILPEKEDELWLVKRDAAGHRTYNQGDLKLVP